MNNHDFIEALLFISMSKAEDGFKPTPAMILEDYLASLKT